MTQSIKKLQDISSSRSLPNLIWAILSFFIVIGLTGLFMIFYNIEGILFSTSMSLLFAAGLFFTFSWALYETIATGSEASLKKSPFTFYFNDGENISVKEAIITAENFTKIGLTSHILGLTTFLIHLELWDVVILTGAVLGLSIYVIMPEYYRKYGAKV